VYQCFSAASACLTVSVVLCFSVLVMSCVPVFEYPELVFEKCSVVRVAVVSCEKCCSS
jgi:hypothetical protein